MGANIFVNLMRSFWGSLIYCTWGTAIGFVVNGVAVFDFLQTQWLWALLVFILLWICLLLLPRPARKFKSGEFIPVAGGIDDTDDTSEKGPSGAKKQDTAA